MCDLGLALGIAAGAAEAAGTAAIANQKADAVRRGYQVDQANNERNFIIKANAANKDGYQATLDGDRARSQAIATGAEMNGPTPGLRLGEQSRQTALSIANIKDQRDGALADYVMEGKARQMGAQATLSSLRPNAFSTFTDIATSGLKTYGDFQ